MTPTRRLLLFPAAGLVAALLWTSLGTVTAASGQEAQAIIARAHEGSHAPSFKEPIFLLMLGGDAHKGNPSNVRMDSIHIVGIDPVSKKASLVGIPRDSYVDIPGRGKGKITGAGLGGPEVMVRTMENLSGCKFDYYTLTNFEGFRKLVDEIGGIEFNVEERIYEKGGSNIDLQPGRQTFDGVDALAWARNRKNRPGGDFDRSFEQGQLMIAALEEAKRDYETRPGWSLRALASMRKHLKMDIPLEEALKLGMLSLSFEPEDVTNIVADGEVGTAGSASIVRITQTGLNQLADVCADGVLGN